MATNKNATEAVDPTDWPENLHELREIDKLLRCPICYEYMTTAMIIPQCSHSYCSLCIRRYIAFKNQCPTCTEPVSEPLLRNNRILDEIIQKFSSVRSRLLNLVNGLKIAKVEVPAVTPSSLRTSPRILPTPTMAPSPPKPSRLDPTTDPDLEIISIDHPHSAIKESLPKIIPQPRQPFDKSIHSEFFSPSRKPPLQFTSPTVKFRSQRSPSQSLGGSISRHSLGGATETVTSPEACSTNGFSGLTVPSPSRPVECASEAGPSPGRSNIKRVPCPVCGVEIPERNINLHLDRCLSGETQPATRSNTPKRKLMPKLVYSLMKDKELKKKLAEVGLPTTGDRQAMIKRHSELTLQYNAQCDSLNPKSAQEIVKEVLSSDKTKQLFETPAKVKDTQRLQLQKSSSPASVDIAQKQYVKKHKSQFAQLISDARKRMAKEREASGLTETKAATSGERESPAEGKTDHEEKPIIQDNVLDNWAGPENVDIGAKEGGSNINGRLDTKVAHQNLRVQIPDEPILDVPICAKEFTVTESVEGAGNLTKKAQLLGAKDNSKAQDIKADKLMQVSSPLEGSDSNFVADTLEMANVNVTEPSNSVVGSDSVPFDDENTGVVQINEGQSKDASSLNMNGEPKFQPVPPDRRHRMILLESDYSVPFDADDSGIVKINEPQSKDNSSSDMNREPKFQPVPPERRHRMILLESDHEEDNDADCCSPSLYSDNNSQPGSSWSTLPYGEMVAAEQRIEMEESDAPSRKPASELEALNQETSNSSDFVVSHNALGGAEPITQNAEGEDDAGSEMSEVLVPLISTESTSPVFTETTKSRKRKRTTKKKPSPPPPSPSIASTVGFIDADQALQTVDTNVMDTETPPPVKRRRGRPKKVPKEETQSLSQVDPEIMENNSSMDAARPIAKDVDVGKITNGASQKSRDELVEMDALYAAMLADEISDGGIKTSKRVTRSRSFKQSPNVASDQQEPAEREQPTPVLLTDDYGNSDQTWQEILEILKAPQQSNYVRDDPPRIDVAHYEEVCESVEPSPPQEYIDFFPEPENEYEAGESEDETNITPERKLEVEEEPQTENVHRKQRRKMQNAIIQRMQTENQVMALDLKIKRSLVVGNIDVYKCVEALEDFDKLEVSATGMSHFPEILATIKKCCHFSASPLVRSKARETYNKIKKMFVKELRPHFVQQKCLMGYDCLNEGGLLQQGALIPSE